MKASMPCASMASSSERAMRAKEGITLAAGAQRVVTYISRSSERVGAVGTVRGPHIFKQQERRTPNNKEMSSGAQRVGMWPAAAKEGGGFCETGAARNLRRTCSHRDVCSHTRRPMTFLSPGDSGGRQQAFVGYYQMPQRSDDQNRTTIGSVAGLTLRTLSSARHTGTGWIKVDIATAPSAVDTELES